MKVQPTVLSLAETGPNGLAVTIECSLSNSLPNIVIVGSVSKTVDEACERIHSAFAASNLTLPRKRITINLARLAKNNPPSQAVILHILYKAIALTFSH